MGGAANPQQLSTWLWGAASGGVITALSFLHKFCIWFCSWQCDTNIGARARSVLCFIYICCLWLVREFSWRLSPALSDGSQLTLLR